MTKLILGMVMVGAIGCAGDDASGSAPSCQQASSHYYASGCVEADLSKNPPAPYTEAQFTALCQQLNSEAGSCRGLFNDWKACLDSTPAHATTNAQCDCSTEQDALFACSP